MGSRDVTTADVGDFVLRYHPDVAGGAVARLVRAAVVEAEAAREGVSVPADVLDAAALRATDERLRRLRLEYGAGTDPAEALRRTTGRSVADLRADLARALRTDLLRERVARLEALRRDGAEVRVLVLPDERPARAAAAQWRDGADAALLARRLGAGPPAAPPPLALDDVPDAGLRARLAAAAAGDVLDPAPFEAEDPAVPGSVRTWWQVFKVVRVWRASAEPWAALAPAVEEWLRAAPPGDEELTAWDARAARRTGVAPWPSRASPPAETIAPR